MQILQGDDDWVDVFKVDYDPDEIRFDRTNPMYGYSLSLYYAWLSALNQKPIKQGIVLMPRRISFAELADMLLLPDGLTS